MNPKTAIVYASAKFREKGITSAPLDAEVLLLEAINGGEKNRSWLYLNFEKYILSREEEKTFRSFIRRRERYEPVAYIIRKKEFCGFDFFVDKNVLIPRPETEIIVREVLDIIKNAETPLTLIDIGTGSGCIPVSILKSSDTDKSSSKIRKVYANDISEKALDIAKINAKKHKASSRMTFLKCDLEIALEKIKDCKNLILTANLPYITPEDYEKLNANVKNFEPKIALTTKDKGLYHIARLIKKFGALSANMSSYHIFLEADPKQMRGIEIFTKTNLPDANVETIKDLRGKKRVAKLWKR